MAKITRTRELLKNSLSIGIGTIASKLIVFLLVPLYSRWLTPEEYGTFDLVITYITLCVPFATLQLEQAIYINCVSGNDDSRQYYTSALAIIIPLLCIVSLIVLYVMLVILHLNYAPSFILYFCAYSFFNLNAEYARGKKDLMIYSVANVAYAILVLATSSVAVVVLRAGINGMLTAYGCSYLVVALALFFKYKPFNPELKSISTLKEMLKLSIPLIPNSISWWITNVSNRTFINYYLGTFYNGLFAVSSKIPTVVSLLYGVFNLAFQQTAFDSISDDDRSEYFLRLFKTLTRILVTGCIIITALVPAFYWLAIDSSYWDGMGCIPILLSAAILLSLGQFLGDILLSERKTTRIGSSTIVAAIATIVLNALLVPICGLNGAAFGSLVAYAVMLIMRIKSLTHHFDMGSTIVFVVRWMGLFIAASVFLLISTNSVWGYFACALCEVAACIFVDRDVINNLFTVMRRA